MIAVFDESGKLHDSQMVVFAGCIASPDDWGVLATRWQETLDAHGLPYTSMKDAMTFSGPYRDWRSRERERDELLLLLAKQLEASIAAKIVAWQTSDSFKKLPQTQRKALKNINYCAFEGCVKSILGSTPQPFILYCDDSTEYSDTVLKLYHRMRERDSELKKRCAAISFCEDEQFTSIQAADMFAYCCRSHLSNERRPLVENIYDILTSKGGSTHVIEYRGNASLGAGSMLKPK